MFTSIFNGLKVKQIAIAFTLLAIILILTSLLSLSYVVHAASGGGTLSLIDDFEDEDIFDPPSSNWYTFTTGGTGSGIIRDNNGDQVYRQSSTTGFVSTWNHASAGKIFDRDNTMEVGAKIKIQPPPGEGWTGQKFGWCHDSCGGGSFYFTVDALGDVSIVNALGGTAALAPTVWAGPTGISSTTPLEVWVFDSSCSVYLASSGAYHGECGVYNPYNQGSVSIRATVYFPVHDFLLTVSDGGVTAGSGKSIIYGPSLNFQIANGNADLYHLELTEVPALPAPPLESRASAQVTGLVGFDVDKIGENIIVRTNGGGKVEAYNAVSLQQVGVIDTPNCVQFDGVSAIRTHLAYIDCKTDGTVDVIKIASPSLGPPAKPSGCGEQCTSTLDDEGWPDSITIPNELKEMKIIGNTGLYTFSTNNNNHVTVAFAFSDFHGNVGVWAATYNNDANDEDDIEKVLFDTTASPDISQLCYWRTAESDDKLGAVTPYGATKIFDIIVNAQKEAFKTTYQADVSIFATFTNAATYSQSNGIDCATDRAIVKRTTGDVYLFYPYGPNMGSLLHPPFSTTDTGPRGVAMSADGNWAAYKDGANIQIINVQTGNITGSVPVPGGSWRGMKMDALGSNLYAFTDTNIAAYEIIPLTTVVPPTGDVDQFGQVTAPDGPGSAGSTTGAKGPVSRIIAGWSSTTRFVVGLVLVAIFSGIAYRLAGPAPMIVGGAATLGLCAAVVVVGFPLWIPVTIAAGGLGTFAAMIAKRVGGS